MMKKIIIKGAKEHNLKNVSVDIPKDKASCHYRAFWIRKIIISI